MKKASLKYFFILVGLLFLSGNVFGQLYVNGNTHPTAAINVDAIKVGDFNNLFRNNGSFPAPPASFGGVVFGTNAGIASNTTSGSTNGNINGLDFYTNGNNKRMSITNGGNVGIGIVAPNAPLQFSNGFGRKIVFFEGGNNENQFYGFSVNPFTFGYHVNQTGDDHVFYAGTGPAAGQRNELMRIKGNGNVGIGNNIPNTLLHVGNKTGVSGYILEIKGHVHTNNNPSSLGFTGIKLSTGDIVTNNDAINNVENKKYIGIQAVSENGPFGDLNGIGFTIRNSGPSEVEKSVMRIDNRGFVGINNNAPGGRLHVNNPGNQYMLYSLTGNLVVYNPEGISNTEVRLGNAWGIRPGVYCSQALHLMTGTSTSDMMFGSANNEFMRLSATGNLILANNGTQADNLLNTQNSKLFVQGNLHVSGLSANAPNSNGNGLIMGHNNNTGTPNYNYSWIQSQNETPLLLNPVSNPALLGAGLPPNTTNNFVGIGFPYNSAAKVPQGYILAVKGNIMCEELKVKVFGNWPDYVFDGGRPLMKLDSLESYIQANKHLPGVPTAQEVEENGIKTGEMHAKLLEKVEELTLYMIQQNKNMEALQAENEKMKAALTEIQNKK